MIKVDDGPVVSVVMGNGSEAHRLVRVSDWSLRVACADGDDEEPRIQDIELAARLGYARPRKIRDLIERLIADGKLNNIHHRPTVGRSIGQVAPVPADEYWLTEEQALLVTSQSRTPKAWELTVEMVRVFLLAKQGLLNVERVSPERAGLQDDFDGLLRRMEALETAHRFVTRSDEPLAIGNGAARLQILDPLAEIARLVVALDGKPEDLASIRSREERRVRDAIGFPTVDGARWPKLPKLLLPAAVGMLDRRLGELRRRAGNANRERQLALRPPAFVAAAPALGRRRGRGERAGRRTAS